MRIGMIGLGRMGTAMALRLIEGGHELTVWNRTAARAAPVVEAGATLAATPYAVANAADVIFVIMFDETGLEAVFRGPDSILAAQLNEKLVIEMSTVRPEIEQSLAHDVVLRGGAFIECPVGGTTGPARTGKLLGLVGGSDQDFARARPLLMELCRRVEHVGPVGAGASMKLAINLPLAVFWQTLGEATALVRHLKRDPVWLMELFSDTSGGNNALKSRGPVIASALAGGDGGEATFDLDGIRKDLRVMLEEARSRGFDLPLAGRSLAIYDQASAAGMGARDPAWVPAWWAHKADAPTPPTRLTLDLAQTIVDAARRKGRELALNPLTVVVLDPGGHLVASAREDGSGILRHDIAFGKAWASLGMGFNSRELVSRAQTVPSFVAALTAASGGRVIPVPGGVLIRSAAGEVLGAVGITGDTSDNDEACAMAGIAAAGFS